ncbi:hypothetical protein PN437_15485 [Microcystis aeruginosa CS-564/01]|uniref:hypothetical protein n=1 Tax=Microcystis aeruginosa TaxID=1126 RepID=UPI00232F2743|nr:hypothetical protein [Microcystis aeruginosa]MDB9426272.1 hypothetical protein [Microcystis aeruginosa CS-564/01]
MKRTDEKLLVVMQRLSAAAYLSRYTESVFNSMINSQSHWKNPLPFPYFPLLHTC